LIDILLSLLLKKISLAIAYQMKTSNYLAMAVRASFKPSTRTFDMVHGQIG
jgi:hypothetical protein